MSDPNHQTLNPGSNLLHRFRSDRKRLPLHPLEKAVLTVVALHLCFLPWALGTMHAWSQLTSLGFGVLGLAVALIPRTYSGDYALPAAGHQFTVNGLPSTVHRSSSAGYRLIAWPRLVRFPLFWIGLALLAYIAVQGFNPSWVWERNATSWWLRRVNDIPWLPTSIDAPFQRFNVWRQFIIYASAWLTVCTVWVGFTRRRSLQVLLITVLANATLLAFVGFAHRVVSPASFLGLFDWPRGSSAFASFIYKNHAGAYFALAMSLAVALGIWFHLGGRQHEKKSTPTGILFFGALALAAAAAASASRGAVITSAFFLFMTALWYFVRRKLQPRASEHNTAITVAVVLMFLGAIAGTIRYADFSAIRDRFEVLLKDPGSTTEGRKMASSAGSAMLADSGLRGIGAGGFRHLFPEYIKRYPDVYQNGTLFWDHVHRDWLEIPIELGAAGTLLLLLGGGYWLLFFLRLHRAPSALRPPSSVINPPPSIIWHPLVLPVLLGCSQTLIHAWFDFPFQNPAILITWLVLVTVSARWLELDAS